MFPSPTSRCWGLNLELSPGKSCALPLIYVFPTKEGPNVKFCNGGQVFLKYSLPTQYQLCNVQLKRSPRYILKDTLGSHGRITATFVLTPQSDPLAGTSPWKRLSHVITYILLLFPKSFPTTHKGAPVLHWSTRDFLEILKCN